MDGPEQIPKAPASSSSEPPETKEAEAVDTWQLEELSESESEMESDDEEPQSCAMPGAEAMHLAPRFSSPMDEAIQASWAR